MQQLWQFSIANEGIVMPSYGIPADEQARDMLAGLFPDRTVVLVNIDAIVPGGGIHFIIQQQPVYFISRWRFWK